MEQNKSTELKQFSVHQNLFFWASRLDLRFCVVDGRPLPAPGDSNDHQHQKSSRLIYGETKKAVKLIKNSDEYTQV